MDKFTKFKMSSFLLLCSVNLRSITRKNPAHFNILEPCVSRLTSGAAHALIPALIVNPV
jgi:hypothetical protein